MSPKNTLCDTMLTSTLAFINMSEYNNVYNPFNCKTLAVNSSVAAKRAREVSPNEVKRHVEDNSRGSLTIHIGEPSPILLPLVSQSCGLSSFNIEGPNTLKTPP